MDDVLQSADILHDRRYSSSSVRGEGGPSSSRGVQPTRCVRCVHSNTYPAGSVDVLLKGRVGDQR